MAMPRSVRIALWIAAGIVLLLIQASWSPSNGSLLTRAAFDAGHAPLFGLFALCVLRVLSLLTRRAGGASIYHYLLALGVTAAAAGLAEIAQLFGSRDADLLDLGRGILGGLAALLIALRLNPAAAQQPGMGRMVARVMIPLAAVAILVAFAPFAVLSVAYLQRDAAFPNLCDFRSRWVNQFIETRNVELALVDPPDAWERDAEDLVARVTFRPDQYPGLLIKEPHPNWRDYDRLVFDVFSHLTASIELILRIDDAHHRNDYFDRFNRTLTITPGANQIAVPLQEIRDATRDRQMDLARIHCVVLFAVAPSDSFSVYVDSFRLEECDDR